LTPGDAANSDSDRKITQLIRRSIVIEKGPDQHSVAARNIQIVTRNGAVTLRGVVRSDQERADLERRARKVAGVTQVHNQLQVKGEAPRQLDAEATK
jgi:osmotically-inducible protein OsmY